MFAIAEEALDCMRRGAGTGGTDPTGAGDQTIVVSGERYDVSMTDLPEVDDLVEPVKQYQPNSSCDTLLR